MNVRKIVSVLAGAFVGALILAGYDSEVGFGLVWDIAAFPVFFVLLTVAGIKEET